jgi:dethiobiotin synthetase
LRGVFVTGTDTEVGKSVVAACICAALTARGERVAAFKPVVTGLDEEPGEFGRDHELLAAAASAGQTPADVTPHVFGPAVSPHLAAELAGMTLEPRELVEAARALTQAEPGEERAASPGEERAAGRGEERAAGPGEGRAAGRGEGRAAGRGEERAAAAGSGGRLLVCEGVGGLLVPITPGYLVRDLAIDLGLPVVVAARPGLGTINHTLLTVEAARAGGLTVAAVVMTPWPDEPSAMERSNRDTIARLGDVSVTGLRRTTPDRLAEAGASLPVEDWL